MRHRRSVTDNRNFPRTGEGYRNVRRSVARALASCAAQEADLATEDPVLPAPPTEAELWEAERLREDAADLLYGSPFDHERECCHECARPDLWALVRS